MEAVVFGGGDLEIGFEFVDLGAKPVAEVLPLAVGVWGEKTTELGGR